LEQGLAKPAARWQDVYDDILVPLSAEWDAFELSVRDLMALRVNDVVEMPTRLISETKIRIEDRTCFVGEIGLEGEQVAFKVNVSCIEANNLLGKSHG
jgi:flagellar motor switch protein FliM